MAHCNNLMSANHCNNLMSANHCNIQLLGYPKNHYNRWFWILLDCLAKSPGHPEKKKKKISPALSAHLEKDITLQNLREWQYSLDFEDAY